MAELQDKTTILEDIVRTVRARLEGVRGRAPRAELERTVEARRERRDFAGALAASPARGQGPRVIAELKKASPSAGLLRRDYHPQQIARDYESAGAAALSILTEPDFFLGSLADLKEARAAAGLPVLRKDFILDDYQVYESVGAGADALLLIVAALEDAALARLLELSGRLRIEALVEVHTADELQRALGAGARILGVNNRNLKTMEVNLETSLRLREQIPGSCLAISESGIKTAADLQRLGAAGYHAVLIGERLMTSEEPGQALAALLGTAAL